MQGNRETHIEKHRHNNANTFHIILMKTIFDLITILLPLLPAVITNRAIAVGPATIPGNLPNNKAHRLWGRCVVSDKHSL